MLTFIIPWNPRLGCGPCVHNTCEQFYDFQCIARTVFMFLSQWISCFDGICDFRERPKRELMKNRFEEIMGSKPPNVLETEDWLQTSKRGWVETWWKNELRTDVILTIPKQNLLFPELIIIKCMKLWRLIVVMTKMNSASDSKCRELKDDCWICR